MVSIRSRFAWAGVLPILGLATIAFGGTISDVKPPANNASELALLNSNGGDTPGDSFNIWSWEVEFDGLSPVDIEVVVDNSDGLTEYAVLNEIRRTSGEALLFPGFDLQILADDSAADLNFDVPNPDSPVEFDLVAPSIHEPRLLRWSNIVANDSESNLKFHIDIPDFGSNATYSFILRYTPIPEPSSLLVLSTLMVFMARRSHSVD